MIKKILIKLANLKLAIFLLLLIAFSSSLGSIIEQDKEAKFYLENYSYSIDFFGFSTADLLINLGLNHVYTTWWFLFFLFLFGICLLSCTFLQQFPALKFARRYYFYKQPKQLEKFNYTFNVQSFNLNLITYTLNRSQYSVFQQKNTFYAYKGLISRIGPIVVHISIISILIGSILGSLGGFNAQEFVPKTEIFHLQNIVKNGNLAQIPQNNFRINDFWSTYTRSGEIKQFHSDVSILNGEGKEMLRQTLSVNKPLHFQGLTLYQTDWGVTGLRVKVLKKNEESLQVPLSQTLQENQKIWISWIPYSLLEEKGLIFVINNNRGQIQTYDEKGFFLQKTNLGENIRFNNELSLKISDFIVSSGIQIKSDPGLFTIYGGFFSLIISSFVSYISFSEIWVVVKNSQAFCGGRTNRAKLKFQIEIARLQGNVLEI